MNSTPDQSLQQKLRHLLAQAGTVILGKDHAIRLAVATMLASGHLLITDRPGVGKTTLANLLASLFGLDFKRVQFTSDLLPADITGVTIFDQKRGGFVFHPGPLFAQLVLADEINRATPKCQSALLEAMEERQVTIDRNSRKLPTPFFVIATRNPTEQSGTFALPESQLDRFMLGISMGYPDRDAERQMLSSADPRGRLSGIDAVFDGTTLLAAQLETENVIVAPAMLDYVQGVLEFSRRDQAFVSGYSPRAGISLLRASKAWALLDGRNHVVPEDLQAILPASVHHLSAREPGTNLGTHILNSVAIP